MKNLKTKKIGIIVLSILIVLMLIGGSYAVFYYYFTGDESVINKESIELEFLESSSEVINLEKALPMSDNEGKAQSEVFEFQVTTRTSSEQDIWYALSVEHLFSKCSDIENPTQETYSMCYDTIISDEDSTAIIDWMMSNPSLTYTREETEKYYNLLYTKDMEGLKNFYMMVEDCSIEEANANASWDRDQGFINNILFNYNSYSGETINATYQFNGDNDIYYVNWLTDGKIKIYLEDFDGNVLLEPIKIGSLDNYVLYKKINSHSSTNVEQIDKYRLRVWIDEDVDVSRWDENTDFDYTFKIGVKSFPSEVTLMSGSAFNDLFSSEYKAMINEIKFIEGAKVINTSNAISSDAIYDVSENQDGSITAWIEDNVLYVATEREEMFLNENSRGMFDLFSELTIINANELNATRVVDINSMFGGTSKLINLDLSSWITPNLTEASLMFCDSGVTEETLILSPISNIDDYDIFGCPL